MAPSLSLSFDFETPRSSRLRVVRLELRRLLEVLDGALVVALLLVREAERDARFVVVRLEVERPLELADAFVHPLEAHVGRAQVRVARRGPWAAP
jgi:hypothetical protein